MPTHLSTSNSTNSRNSSPPLLTAEDQVRYAFNEDAQWKWHASEKACEACRSLHGKCYTYPDIPQRPHPNCKCTLVPVEDEQKQKRFIGWLKGYEAHERKSFNGSPTITIEFSNIGIHGAGVNFIVWVGVNRHLNGEDIADTMSTGLISPGTTKDFKFSKFGLEKYYWNIDMVVSGGDNTTIQYTITY